MSNEKTGKETGVNPIDNWIRPVNQEGINTQGFSIPVEKLNPGECVRCLSIALGKDSEGNLRICPMSRVRGVKVYTRSELMKK